MPSRQIPIVPGEIYHIFNRGIDRRPTFIDKRELNRALSVIRFYQFASPSLKLSRFLTLSLDEQTKILEKISKLPKLNHILAFCLMPNHFHFLLRQETENGISKFMSQFQNSYTKYFNTKHERTGPLFLGQFKAVRIETDEQLVHVSRYIHLNPYTSYVIKNIQDLTTYPWSSFVEYISKSQVRKLCDKDFILARFKKQSEYKQFVFDQANYQRDLDKIKHLTLEKK